MANYEMPLYQVQTFPSAPCSQSPLLFKLILFWVLQGSVQ